jgi:hypothetical protein
MIYPDDAPPDAAIAESAATGTALPPHAPRSAGEVASWKQFYWERRFEIVRAAMRAHHPELFTTERRAGAIEQRLLQRGIAKYDKNFSCRFRVELREEWFKLPGDDSAFAEVRAQAATQPPPERKRERSTASKKKRRKN